MEWFIFSNCNFYSQETSVLVGNNGVLNAVLGEAAGIFREGKFNTEEEQEAIGIGHNHHRSSSKSRRRCRRHRRRSSSSKSSSVSRRCKCSISSSSKCSKSSQDMLIRMPESYTEGDEIYAPAGLFDEGKFEMEEE